MSTQTTLLLGANSAMAVAAARLLAADGDRLLLAGRDAERLQIQADDLSARGASEVKVLPLFDALKPETFAPCLAEAGEVDRVLIAFGNLPDQEKCQTDPIEAVRQLEINFISQVRLCTLLANQLEQRGEGTLAVISSVAGLRGRQSNYLYGAAKGGLNVFLQGLRNRLHPKGVRVVTILPGFVDSPMTAHLPKGPLFVSAAKAGACIHKALTASRKDVVYVPFFWRYILWVIRAIPESIFKGLKL